MLFRFLKEFCYNTDYFISLKISETESCPLSGSILCGQRFLSTKSLKIHFKDLVQFRPQVNAVKRNQPGYNYCDSLLYWQKSSRLGQRSLPDWVCIALVAVHESTGFTPTFLNFSRFVVPHASFYEDIESINQLDISTLDSKEYANELGKLPIINEEVLKSFKYYEKNTETYDLRKGPLATYCVGDRIWRRKFALSNATANFTDKLAPKFVSCIVKKHVSPLVYRLTDLDGKDIGYYHVKYLKPYCGEFV